MEDFFEIQGVRVPRFIYGTAWKEERTAVLTGEALAAGFRGIDTANQRKHYFEADVGRALAACQLDRRELFLQTKFTYLRGQDHRLPYDPKDALDAQVAQSFASSLDHLGVDYIDSYVLHGPESGHGWSAGDREVWRAMEMLQRAGKIRLLGVSNISHDQLLTLCAEASIPPAIVQNRCYARTGWDREVRAVCRERGMAYQGFSLLTANRAELQAQAVTTIAQRLGTTVPQVIFRFALAVGMMPLTGTSSRLHMEQDLAALKLHLETADVSTIERLGG